MGRPLALVACVVLVLGVEASAQQKEKAPEWLPYASSPEMPRTVKPDALDKVKSGMTLGEVVNLLGKAWVHPTRSGTGIITWGCTDGRDLRAWPRWYTKEEVLSFNPEKDKQARMWIERGLLLPR